MSMKCSGVALSLLILTGCYTRVRPDIDAMVCASASRPVDVLPADVTPSETPKATVVPLPPGKTPSLLDRMQLPPAVPGADVPPIRLPNPKEVSREQFQAAVRKYFPPLSPIGPDPQAVPGPEGRPLSLADLQALARANSPLLRQAASDVSAAQGAAIQSGAYPNPTAGVTSMSRGPSGGPTYGVLLGQTIKTMGKLKLAQAAAIMDLENAQLAYRRAETDLMAQVRGGYFQVIVAQESMRASRGLANLTDEVYKVMVEQVGGGEAAPYEPMQVAVFAAQARQALIVSRNNYTLAWKQLTSSMGIRGMPPTELEGRVDLPLPKFEYDQVLAHVLTSHTDVASATIAQQKARYNLRLAEVTAVPDVSVQTTIENDNAPGASNRIIAGVQATVPVPVWDRNLGAIQQARGALVRAVEEQHRVRDDLTARVADAFRRYDENRAILQLYRVDILPKQVQAFRAAVTRHYAGEIGKVAYNDLVTSEQNLVGVIGPYITVLAAQWQAVVDVAHLLQNEDLFQANGVCPVAPLPDLERLLQLPCCHPCSPLPGSVMVGADQMWPPSGFAAPSPAVVPSSAPSQPGAAAGKNTGAPATARLPVGRGEAPTIDGIPVRPIFGRPHLVEANVKRD